MSELIPTFQNKSAKFKQVIVLEGKSIEVQFRWNSTCGFWYLNLITDDYSIYQRKLTFNYPLLRQVKAEFPVLSGDIVALPTTINAPKVITYENLNQDIGLFYLPFNEVIEWEKINGF